MKTSVHEDEIYFNEFGPQPFERSTSVYHL